MVKFSEKKVNVSKISHEHPKALQTLECEKLELLKKF